MKSKTLSIFFLVILPFSPCLGAEAWTDDDIARAIEQRINWDTEVSGHGLTVTVDDGVVTLDGSVTNYLEKKRAERIAASRKGVRSIIDRVTVDAGPIADRDISAAIREALEDEPAFDEKEIEVSTNDGIVRLSGSVDVYGLRPLAENTAASIIGVRGIENDLTVRRDADPRSDEEIQSHIAQRFRNDIWLNGQLINVNVDEGKVTLSGSAGTVRQQIRAVQKAWVPGVVAVDRSTLAIDPQMRDSSRRQPEQTERTDGEIAEAIRDSLKLHPAVMSYKVNVAVEDGVVTLTGTVGGITAKTAARRTAQNTVGVARVNDLITVETARPVADEKVLSRVKRRLQTNFYTARYPLRIRVQEGTVILEGMVETPFERNQAEMAAAAVYGVRAVENRIRTDRMLRGYNPGQLEALGDVETLYENRPANAKSDAQLQKAIESEFYWSWWVDSDAVKVSVEDGVATLTGEVDSRREIRACVANAFDAGAVSVVNNLRLKGAGSL